MGKILKWISISACTVMFLLLVLLAGAHLYLKTDQGARRLSTFINTLYPGKITGSEMEVSLLRQEVSMKDAVCIGPDGRKVFTAERASLKIDLRALLRKNVVFEFIKASKPDFVLELDKDGWLNIEAVFAWKTPGESEFNVYIRKLTCTDGTFTYRTGKGEPVVRLEHFDLNMDSSFEKDTLMHLALPKAHMFLSVAGKRIDLGDGHASGTIFNDTIRDIRIATKKNTSQTDLTGSITGMSEKAQLHWDLAFDADMADLRDALGLGKDNTGRITGIISARRDYDNPDLACNLAYSGGHLSGLTIGKAALNGAVTDRVAKIKELSGGFASGRIVMSGTVDMRRLFRDGYFEGIRDGEVASYALSLISTGINLSGLPGIPGGMKGTLRSEMIIEGKGWNPDTLSLNVSSLTARASGFTADGMLRNAEISIEGRGAYQSGEVFLNPLITKTAGATLITQGKLNLSSGVIAGTLNLASPQISGLLGRYGVRARGSLNAAATVSGTLKRPDADISLVTKNSALEDIILGDVDMEARLDPSGTLTINRCTVKNSGSTVEAAGSVQLFSDFPRIDPDPPIKIEADLTSLSLHDFTASIPVKGPLSGRITAIGSASSLSGDMKLHGSDISFADINLGTIELEALLDKGILTVSNLSLSKGCSSLKTSGSARLLQDNRLAVVPNPQIDFRTTEG
jgi:autotransporter translocation and assembly factor TamB